MGVPAFYRWLSEKYPKIVIDVLEERVQLAPGSVSVKLPFDSTKPNPNGFECDNLYVDMNGIIHPCSHPEIGPQPETEEEMYENVCAYVDRLFRIHRPRKLLYLAIDGVAPRAKMNQQRARRFRSAQEARELAELEKQIKQEVYTDDDHDAAAANKKKLHAWDSNVITPGTPFMLKLAEFVRFYVRKRISTDPAWKTTKVIFSDASIPGEGEHKIMNHIRLQRAQSGYNPNTTHILHGLDADLIMLALATHEINFYISREEVTFGRKSEEMKEQRQIESGFRDQQVAYNEEVGDYAMQLIENQHKPLQLISIPILREYLAIEFAPCLQQDNIPFPISLERLIDDFVFMCFFVGNDFLPHLPSLDIRDGALDYLINVYQRILPGLGDYITKSGGNVNLSNVDVLLAEVGQIEDYVFQMKHENEQQEKKRREDMKKRNNRNNNNNKGPPIVITESTHKVRGKAAKILEKQQQQQQETKINLDHDNAVPLHSTRKEKHLGGKHKNNNNTIKVSHMKTEDNAVAAYALKLALSGGTAATAIVKKDNDDDNHNVKMELDDSHDNDNRNSSEDVNNNTLKKKLNNGDDDDHTANQEEGKNEQLGGKKKRNRTKFEAEKITNEMNENGLKEPKIENGVGEVGDAVDEFDADDDDDDVDDDDAPKIDDIVKTVDPKVALLVKEKVKSAQQKQLDEFARNVVDNVRLHEAGWKDRYYSDKCKADDVKNHGGREHMFRSYVMGLCWVMKYYYDGVPSWKWYYPFHYSPFASDLKNIERFEKDCRSFEISKPFNPVEQLMAVLPSDSSHAIPKASRWLLSDPESPILDFYPSEVPVDPNGKAMPWLWVVLLPFIEEDRLLAALSPTMAKWTPTELLGNARGLDDGYLYIHRKEHVLSKKLSSVLVHARESKSAAANKTRLTDAVQYGISGSVRVPLSNEFFPPDQDVIYPLPPTAAFKINTDNEYSDIIFSEPIDPNDAICVAFTEPPKLSHKSILLPGVKIPRPTLVSAEDRLIRRPRLNRFGGTIANLGGGGGMPRQGQSYQSGYGSMNISQYERDLARQTGRGHEMYQAGTRTWGSMEPTPKRFHGPPQPPPPPPPPPNHVYQGRGPAVTSQQPWQSNTGYPNHRPYQQGPPPPAPYQHHQGYGFQQQNQPQPQQHQYGYGVPQQQQHYQRSQPPHQYHQSPPPPPPPHRQQQQQQQGHSVRHGYGQQQPPPNQRQPPQRANADVMNSLRAQLTSTLHQSRKNKNSTGADRYNNNRR